VLFHFSGAAALGNDSTERADTGPESLLAANHIE